MTIHVVRPGETLTAIAGQYNVAPDFLRIWNGVPDTDALAVGQTLLIQTIEASHTVQPGETLDAIARRYGLTRRQLYRNNYQLGGRPDIQPGQTLVIRYAEEKLGSTFTNGYAYPFIPADLLRETLPYMSFMTPFTYGITAQGDLLPLDDQALLGAAEGLGTAPLMHLSTLTESGGFSSQRAVDVLANPEVQATLLEQILATMQRKNYRGLDVDFEFLPAAQRTNYADFIRQLRERVSPMGIPLFVALPPKTYAEQPGLLYEGIDYALLAQSADFLLLMTYEWGYTYGPPMAVAPLPNVRRVVDFAVTQMAPQKIYLGIPNYGYDWPLPFRQGETRAQSISNQEAVAIALRYGAEIQYDETAQSPWFRYTDENGVVHEVWFEDARSMSAKLRLIQEYGLQGAGYWNLMRPYPQGWAVLNALYDVQSAL